MKSTAIPTSSSRRRHHSSPSSDRFLGAFSFSPPSITTTASATGGYELNEDDVFWSGDFTDEVSSVVVTKAHTRGNPDRDRRSVFQKPEKSGILAALLETDCRSKTLGDGPVLCRKPSISASSTKMIPAIPRSPQISQERDLSQSVSSRNFHQHQSAPMNVPVLSKAMAKQRQGGFPDVVDDEIEDDEMLPPHEIVARGSGMLPNTTFSVLEGVGRTLKGRDLRQVRNAIWRKTGFLD